jgi:hypothetical protein
LEAFAVVDAMDDDDKHGGYAPGLSTGLFTRRIL